MSFQIAPSAPARPSGTEYRPIPWADGYRFGSDGSAWSRWPLGGNSINRAQTAEWRKLRPTERKDGYLSVKLRTGSRGGKLYALHALICEAFHGPRPDGMEVLHDPDRTPSNCRADNLRWGTSAENKADSERHGTRAKGERNGRAKLSPEDIPDIRRMFGNVSTREIAEMYQVDPKLIRKIGEREIWKHIA